jgi:hypothetical protein
VKKSSFSSRKRFFDPFTSPAHSVGLLYSTKGIRLARLFFAYFRNFSLLLQGLLLLIFSIAGVTRLVKHVYLLTRSSFLIAYSHRGCAEFSSHYGNLFILIFSLFIGQSFFFRLMRYAEKHAVLCLSDFLSEAFSLYAFSLWHDSC